MSASAPALRVRKHVVQTSSRELETDDFFHRYDTSAPNSQLPSPVSEMEGDDIDSDQDRISPTSKRRKSFTRARQTDTSDRMDIPLAVALIPPLGTFLTGGDFLRDSLLLLLLFFYLHQLIKLPWDLYMASRPRGVPSSDPNRTLEQRRLHKLVDTELKRSELVYLALSVMAPLLGAALLRYVGTALTGKDYISWFNTGLFVLVSGVRPWRHLSHRLHARAEDLQEIMALSRHKGPDMPTRIAQLEKEIELLKSELATKRDVTAFTHDVKGALDLLELTLGRHKHAAEHDYRDIDERLSALEKVTLKDAHGPRRASWSGGLFDRPKKVAGRSEHHPRRRKSRVVEGWYGRGLLLHVLLYPFSMGRTLLFAMVDFFRIGPLLDVLLYPFGMGRTLFEMVDFLRKHLV